MSIEGTPVAFFRDWLKHQSKIQYAPEWQGGWERWAQGQVAWFMESPDSYQVLTEQHIYRDTPKEAIDLGFRRRNSSDPYIWCELKCYSLGNNDTANTFVKNVLDDLSKVQNPLIPECKGSTLWVVGISQKGFRDSIRSAGQKYSEWQNFNSIEVVTADGGSNFSTMDIWYTKYVNNK